MTLLRTQQPTLEDLLRMFLGERFDAYEWSVEPCYSAPLAEAICRQLQPANSTALVKTVMLGESSLISVCRDAVGEEAWDALMEGFARWARAGRPGRSRR
jgi:hypothetical protein